MKLKSYLRGIGIGILVTAAVFLVSGNSNENARMTDEQVIQRAKELGMTEQVTLVSMNEQTEKDSKPAENDSKSAEKDSKSADKDVVSVEVIGAEDNAGQNTGNTQKSSATATDNIKPTEAPKQEEAKTAVKPTETPKKTEEAKPTTEPTKATAETSDGTTKKAEESKTTEKSEDTKVTEKAAETDKQAEEAASGEDNKTLIIVVNSGDSSDTVSRKLYEAGIVADAREYDQYLMANGYDRTITPGNHKISITASKEEIAKNLTSPTGR